MKGATITSLLLFAVIQAAMCNVTTDPKSFFPIEGNLTRIVWAHAVNSPAELQKALDAAEIMMLEADVVLGTLNNSTNATQIPVMAHPPVNKSDLSLANFLKTVIEKKNVTKGIKLDFKSFEAFNASISILDSYRNDLKFPVFINADILRGPVDATTEPVDAKKFLSLAKGIANCTLSVGWTTRYGTADKITDGRYTEEQVQEMINVLKEQNISQPITYPVRAGLAANNVTVIKSLMEKSSNLSNDVTLTVWSSEGDTVNTEELSSLIKDVGVGKVYVDVPQDLMKRLNFASSSSTSVASITLVLSTIFTVFVSTFM